MTRDHVGFSVFLALLLLAPQVPLRLGGALPDLSGVGLGVLGLAIWFVLVPGHMLRLCVSPVAALLLCTFALYALMVSVVSMRLSSIAYALQYSVYVIMGWLMLGGYLKRAAHKGQLEVVVRIIAVIGLVYSIGVIVSVWTGPIYPHQVLWSARNWGGYFIQQGVGFAEGTNLAGATLIVFCALFCFAIRTRWVSVYALAALTALMLTISRGSIFGFVVGVCALWALDGLRIISYVRFRRGTTIRVLAMVGFLSIMILFGLIMLPSDGLLTAIGTGFGFGGEGLTQSESTRFEYWLMGLKVWADGDIWQLLFGRGFRGSMMFSESGAWLTAHNMYITILGDFGVIGLFLFLAVFVFFLVPVALRIIRDGGSGLERACLVAVLGLLAHNMTEAYLYSPTLITLLLILFGLRVADNGRVYVLDRVMSWQFVGGAKQY